MKKLYDLYLYVREKKYTTLSGGISFFLLLNGGASLFLFLIIIQLSQVNIDNIYLYFPKEVKVFLETFISSANFNTGFSIFFLFTIFYSSSGLFYQLIEVGEIIYRKHRIQRGYKKRIIAWLGMVILFIVIIFSVLFLSVFLNIFNYIQSGFIKVLVNNIVIIILPTILILYLNYFVPPLKTKFKEIMYGVLFTTIFWIIVNYAFQIYINYFFSLNSLYGALSFLIITMLYIYVLVNGLIIGFILNFKFLECKLNNKLDNNIIG